MDQLQFHALCRAAARLMQADIETAEDDGTTLVLTIDAIDVALNMNLGQQPGHLLCYIDLGEPAAHDREAACQQLLHLNLQLADIPGRYAFDIEERRAIFCVAVTDVEELDAEFLAELLRYYIAVTEDARAMISHPEHHVAAFETGNEAMTGLLA